MTKADIYEINYGVSPGGIDMFEVYMEGRYLFGSHALNDAEGFCKEMGWEYEIHLYDVSAI
jgi:hypothetical protein